MAEQLPFGNVEFATNTEPRCPCVLLVDTSGSMGEVIGNAGKDLGQTAHIDGQTYRIVSGGVTKMNQLNEGLRAYHTDLMGDSLATQRVEVSVISFGGTVQTVVPFVTAHEFVPPTLTPNGDTPMGAAIVQAIEAVRERKRLYKQNAVHYFRPWIFLITDGVPTDSWEAAAGKVQEGEAKKEFAFFTVGVGVEGADFEVLRQISTRREPLRLKGYNFREMFVWLSASQRSVSHSNPGQEDRVAFTNPTAPGGWASL